MLIRPERNFLLLAGSVLLIAGTMIVVMFWQAEREASVSPPVAKSLRCPIEGGVTGGVIHVPPIDDPRWDVPSPAFRRSLRRIEPRFTAEAWEACVSGVVEVELLLDAQGKVQDGRVLLVLPYGLDHQAAEAVIHEVFEPARIGREAVPSRLMVSIRFNPNNERQRPE